MDIYNQLIKLLNENNISFRTVAHQEAKTCKEASLARNMDLCHSGKALLFKNKKNEYFMFVLPGDKAIDSKKVRNILRSSWLRFAKNEEFNDLANVPSGALPPINGPWLPLPLYLDESFLDQEWIAFNGGILNRSIIISVKDYFKIVTPVISSFAKFS
ncbi:MAG: YbaK/EbsC family protein [Bacteriovoracia bacterium]